MNFLIPFSSYPPSSPTTGDFIKFTDSAYTAFYNGSGWDFFFEGVPCVLPLAISSFSTDNIGSSTFDSSHGYLYWHQGNVGGDLSALYNTYTNPKTITIGVKMTCNTGLSVSSTGGFGLGVRSSGGAYQVFLLYDPNGQSLGFFIFDYNSSTSFNGEIYTLAQLGTSAGHKLYFQIEDNGTNLIYRVGIDLNNLLTYQTVSRTSFLTPDAYSIVSTSSGQGSEMILFHLSVV